ncbi:unnamed protein product [Owenia fusiformis]|uniref:SCP domain-containing protein n=1 Tax=Owenia fusiformis TaxID=6347 RepID=A0A8S4Q3Y4_OWEFU|nr:unnamed protein product [Owenia fusiformis]
MLFLTLVSFAFVGLTTAAFKDDCLRTHNRLRAMHRSTGSLVWDNKLAQQSAAYSRKLVQLGQLKHDRSRGNVGENLFKRSNSARNWPVSNRCGPATFQWYDEARKFSYNYPNGGFSARTGHFTQLVWKGTRTVGCGEAKGKNGKWYVNVITCRYGPPGNYKGQFQKNVLPLKPGKSYPRSWNNVGLY